MDGRVVLVSGATSGIAAGRRHRVRRAGARVHLLARDRPSAGARKRREMARRACGTATLSSCARLRDFARRFRDGEGEVQRDREQRGRRSAAERTLSVMGYEPPLPPTCSARSDSPACSCRHSRSIAHHDRQRILRGHVHGRLCERLQSRADGHDGDDGVRTPQRATGACSARCGRAPPRHGRARATRCPPGWWTPRGLSHSLPSF